MRFVFCVLTVVAMAATPAIGADKSGDLTEPLWEAGIGGGGFSGPSYPGSDDATSQALFVPFVIYRGEVFSIGEESGARALAFANDTWELDISLGASLAADTDEDADREGMPDMDFLFEIGPQIIFHAGTLEHKHWRSHFDVKLRARAVIATDLTRFDDQGYIIEPALVYELKSKRDSRLEWQLDLEVISGSKRLNEYFYDVDSQYVTASRPAYEAKEGYIGTEIGTSLSYPVNDNLLIFAGFDVEFYNGSANEDSPLFKDDMAYSGGIGLVYTFFESAARVPRR